jgi:hypothetical protein
LLQAEAASKAGVPRDIVHKACQRGSTPRKAETRDAVARVLDVSATWLWLAAPDHERERKPVVKDEPPQIPQATPAAANTNQGYGFRPDPLGHFVIIDSNDYAPIVLGGDTLWVTPSYPTRAGDRVYVTMGNGERLAGSLVAETTTTYKIIVGLEESIIKKTDVGTVEKVSAVFN